MFRCLERRSWRQSHQNGQHSCYVSKKMGFHVVIWEEALLRHAKGRDVIHCLRLYPESELTGSRKRVALLSTVLLILATASSPEVVPPKLR